MMLAALLLLQAASAAAPQAPALPPVSYPTPSPEAIALGRRLAETGTLASLLPLLAAKETDELVAQHPGLSVADQAELRRTAAETLAQGRERVFAAQGRAYAERLSPADLRALVAQGESPGAARYRAALPAAIVATMGSVGGLDFKKDVTAAFCAKTGKACAR